MLCAEAPARNPFLAGQRVDGLTRVLSPGRGELVAGKRLRVRVRIGSGVRSFRAWLGTEEITRSFARSGNDRVAVLDAGRTKALRLGMNHLFVRTRDGRGRRDFDSVRFVRAVSAPSLLRARVHGLVRHGRVPVGLTVGGRRTSLMIRLNGRRVRVGMSTGRQRSFVLDGDQGLRFGRNTIELLALDKRGRYDRERHTVFVRRTGPIPAAGRSGRVRQSHVVRLDARRSRAVHDRRRLRYVWRLVRKPRGSKVRVLGARSARPQLRPDLLGAYRLRLVLTEDLGAAAAAPRSADTVTIDAVPDAPPIGVPISTTGAIGSGVQLGAPVNARYQAPDRNESLQMVVLDRSDLSFVSNASYTGDVTGTGQLLSDVQELSSSQLVIITTPSSSRPKGIDNDESVTNVNSAVEAIGGAPISSAVLTGNDCRTLCSNFSVIGVPGLPPGTSDESADLSLVHGRDDVGIHGALRGYLQLDSSNNFTYVNPDFVPFTTVAAGTTSTQAVIDVGGTGYTSDQVPSGAGFFVLILEADTLDFQYQQTFAVSPAQLTAQWGDMASLLDTFKNDPGKLVFVQSIGNVARPDFNDAESIRFDEVADEITNFGGNDLFFNTLSGGDLGSFAFIAPGNPPSQPSPWAAAATRSATGTQGQLTGVLARNTQSQYYAKTASDSTTFDFELSTLAYRDTVAWPLRDTAAHKAALACVTDAIELPAPVETNYTNFNLDWGGEQSAVDKIEFATLPNVPSCEAGGFEQSDLTAVQDQLDQEFTYVGRVQKLVQNMQSPLGTTAAAVQANFEDIVQALWLTISQPTGEANGDSSTTVAADLLFLGSAIPGVGGVFGLEAEGIDLAEALSNTGSGSPALTAFQAQEAELGTDLGQQFVTAFNELGVIGNFLLTDWGKLQIAGQKATSQWAWTEANDATEQAAFAATTQRWSYDALFPLAFDLFRFGDQSPADVRDYTCLSDLIVTPTIPKRPPFNPFAGAPNAGTTVVTGSGPETEQWTYGDTDELYMAHDPDQRTSGSFPSQNLLNSVFSTNVGNGVNAPPLPSEVAFIVDAYAGQPNTVTNQDTTGWCLVNGTPIGH